MTSVNRLDHFGKTCDNDGMKRLENTTLSTDRGRATAHILAAEGHEPTTTYDKIVIAVITVNLVILAWGLFADIEALEIADQVILWLFVIDLVVRVYRMRGHLLDKDNRKDVAWLAFDIVIIAVALTPLGAGFSALRMLRVTAKLAHFSRHIFHVRWLARLALTAARATR